MNTWRNSSIFRDYTLANCSHDWRVVDKSSTKRYRIYSKYTIEPTRSVNRIKCRIMVWYVESLRHLDSAQCSSRGGTTAREEHVTQKENLKNNWSEKWKTNLKNENTRKINISTIVSGKAILVVFRRSLQTNSHTCSSFRRELSNNKKQRKNTKLWPTQRLDGTRGAARSL